MEHESLAGASRVAMGLVSTLIEREGKRICTKDTCPASESIYGYAPDLPSTIFFVAIFAASSCTFFAQGLLWKGWWGFNIPLILGTLFESIGYIARILLSEDPFSGVGFDLNIVLLTIAPAFLSAGIYLLLKQFCLVFGPEYSRIKPHLYTYIFVSCDVMSIILQAVGGAMSAIGSHGGGSTLTTGTNIMIAGLALQVVTLFVFAVLAIDFAVNVYMHRSPADAAAPLRASLKFRLFVGAVALAFIFIFIRCCYRIAELKGGWGTAIMRDQGEFIVLESVMITLAALVLNIFHPGYCFERPSAGYISTTSKGQRKGDGESEYEMAMHAGIA